MERLLLVLLLILFLTAEGIAQEIVNGKSLIHHLLSDSIAVDDISFSKTFKQPLAITDVPFVKETTILPQRFLRTKNGLFALVNGTGRVYEIKNEVMISPHNELTQLFSLDIILMPFHLLIGILYILTVDMAFGDTTVNCVFIFPTNMNGYWSHYPKRFPFIRIWEVDLKPGLTVIKVNSMSIECLIKQWGKIQFTCWIYNLKGGRPKESIY